MLIPIHRVPLVAGPLPSHARSTSVERQLLDHRRADAEIAVPPESEPQSVQLSTDGQFPLDVRKRNSAAASSKNPCKKYLMNLLS